MLVAVVVMTMGAGGVTVGRVKVAWSAAAAAAALNTQPDK